MNPFRRLFAHSPAILAANAAAADTIEAFNSLAGSIDAVVVTHDVEKRTARMFVPFGDYGPIAGIDRRDGKTKATVQRFDLVAANAIVEDLNTLRGTIARKLRMIPVYVGHPDHQGMEQIYTDRGAKGWIVGANVVDHEGRQGLMLEAEMNRTGMQLIEDEEYLYHSVRWAMLPLTAANEAQQVASPRRLLSTGLTNKPFIAGAAVMANDQMAIDGQPDTGLQLDVIATMLGMPGAAVAEIIARIQQLQELAQKLASGSVLVQDAEWQAREALQTQLTAANTALAAAQATAATERAAAQEAANRLVALESSITAANDTIAQRGQQVTQHELALTAANTALVTAREEVARRTAEIEAANTQLQATRKRLAETVVSGCIDAGLVLLGDRDREVQSLIAANCDEAAIQRLRSLKPVVRTVSILGEIAGRKPAAEQNAALLQEATRIADSTGADLIETLVTLKGRR